MDKPVRIKVEERAHANLAKLARALVLATQQPARKQTRPAGRKAGR